MAVALAAAWALASRWPAGAISASVTADGQAAVYMGSARPGQETPVARLQFNPLAVPWPWELHMQPQSDALQGPSGSVPLNRLQWSASVGPDYGATPRQPLTPGVTVVHRQDQPGYPLVIHWWFRPTWADPASSQPYRLGITYTATTDPENPVSPAVLYPNPYDPAQGPLHVLVRWGGLPDDAGWSGRTVWLQVASLSGRNPPACGDPAAADVYEGPRQSLPVSNPQDPAWIRYPWFEMTWDGRNRSGQPVGPGRYCVAVVMQVDVYGDFTVASGVVDVQPGAAQGSRLAVSVVNRRTGEALPGAWVGIRRPAGATGREARTGGDGRVRFAGLPPGRYVVAARAPGYREATAEITLPVPQAATADTVTLGLEPVEAPRLAVRGVPPAGERASLGDLVRIELSIAAPAATPLGPGEVVVELPEGLAGLPGTLRSSRPQDEARIEAGGRRVVWAVSALPAGTWAELRLLSAVTPAARGAGRLRLAASGAFSLPEPETSGAGGAGRVEAEPAVAELALSDEPWPAASVVIGRVVNERGEGMEGARIRAEDGTATRSGPQGWFTLALSRGPHLLAAFPAGPDEAERPGQGVHALVDMGHPAVHPVVLQLANSPRQERPEMALAASGRAEWNGGPVNASGGLEASVHWGGADARLNLQAAAGSVKVTGARLAAAGHVVAIAAPQAEAAGLLRRFYPARQTGLLEGVAAMRGPVSVWSWAGGQHPRMAAGVAVAQGGSDSSSAAAARSAETVRGVAGARLDFAAGDWWARGQLLEADVPGESRPRRLRWETGLTRWSDPYALKMAVAAEQTEASGGSAVPTGQGLELRLATPGENGGYGLGWRRREGSLAGGAARTDRDPLGAVGGPVASPERAQMLDEFTLSAGLLGWGLRRLTGYGEELADTFAALTVLRPGPVPRRADPKAEAAFGEARGRTQPQPLSIDALLEGAGAGMPVSDGEDGLMQLRVGVVSASAPGEEDQRGSWWRPYLSGAAAWPLAVGPALRRARVGGSLLWLPAVADPARPHEASARGGAWADVAGEPMAGLEVAFRARWEQEVRPGPGADRSGLSLHAELHPKGPVRLGAGARSTASGLRWDELTLAYQRQPVQVELRAGPAELRIAAAVEPPKPWHARLSGRWEPVADGTVTLRELEARVVYLGARWWAVADFNRSIYAGTFEAALGRSTPGWPGFERAAAGAEARPGADEPRGRGAGVLAGAAPSVRLVWKRAWAEGLDLDTVVVEPAVRIPLGARWGLLVEGASAFQWSAAAGWEVRPAAWGGLGLYARTGGETGALEVEMGYRWAGPSTPTAWGAPGLFVRVGSWGKGRWEFPRSPLIDPRR